MFAVGFPLLAFADPATYYVDPTNGVDDVSHDGTTWAKAKQSLVEVMKLAQSGDTVKAAVGVYERGETTVTINSHDALFRVSIPAGVTLVATGACERTIIKGADATTPLYSKGGCGTNSVACVYLAGTDATVQGFTIRDGRAWYESDNSNLYAGGVYAFDAAGGKIVDCRVIGNTAYRTPAGYGGTWVRCCFSDNIGSIGRCLEGASAYNCVFGMHSGGYVVFNCSVYNCTFLPTCQIAVREISSHRVCNSLVLAASATSQGGDFVNCVFGDSTATNGSSTASVAFTDCVKAATAAECAIDPETYEPLTGTVMVDNADESIVTFPAGYGDLDFNGKPRKVRTAMDIGAVEWQGYILTVGEPPDGVTFEGVTVGTNRLVTLPFELAVQRTAVDGRMASRVVLDGKAHYFGDLAMLELTIADADHDMTLTVPDETFFFVDEKLGNDANVGLVAGEGAFATLQAAADKALSGDTVYVAEGLYTNNVKHVAASGTKPAYDVRVSVPAGVSFVATGDRRKTLIVGQRGTSTEFGEDAIRCANLGVGAVLQGFTVTNGYAVVGANSYHQGGGVGADSEAYIVDCDIVNCHAKRAGAGEGGIWIRCYFNDNQSSEVCTGLRSANKLYNCVIDTHSRYFCWDGNFYNCTFTENCKTAFRNTQSTPTGDLFNCLVLSEKANDQGGVFNHCVFGKDTTITWNHCSTQDCVAAETAADVAYDPETFEPQKGTLMMEAADASLVDFPAGYGETDFRGCPRFLNGAMDVGASEYDWRRDFAEALARKPVTVTEAGRMVTLADGVVTIPAGNALTFRVTLEKLGGRVSFRTGGTGTPAVVCKTASVTGRDGVWSFVGLKGQSYDVTITAENGPVTVSDVNMPRFGLYIIFR